MSCKKKKRAQLQNKKQKVSKKRNEYLYTNSELSLCILSNKISSWDGIVFGSIMARSIQRNENVRTVIERER